jgi:hypothetical protein
MKKSLFLMSIALASVAALMVGCSDKETNPRTEGNYSDPSYQQAEQYAQLYIDSMGVAALDAYAYHDWNGSRPTSRGRNGDIPCDSVDIRFNEGSCWWTIYGYYDTTNAQLTVLDSVRFEDDGECQVYPDSVTTDRLVYDATVVFDATYDSGSVSADFAEALDVTDIHGEQVVFNGGASAVIGIVIGQGSVDLDYGSNVTNVTFYREDLDNEEDPHPIAGELMLNMAIDTASPQGSAHGDWTVVATFFIDHYHIHFESGDNYWDWDGPYGG